MHELDNRRGYQAWTFAITSRVRAQRGEVSEAVAALTQARRALWPGGQVFASDLDVAALWIEVLSGRLADAEALLDDAVARSDDEGTLMVSAYLRHEAIRAGLPAARHVDALGEVAAVDQGRRAACWFAHAAALADGRGAGLVDAGHQFATLGMHLMASEAFARAAIALRRAGSLALAAQAKELSRQQRAWCPGARTPALHLGDLVVGLTARELDVATRAGVGKANLDIAEDLGISVRTVETHLQRAFTKLGVNRRADLATLLQPD